ncbi:MAG: YARHG domain-containing protein [Pseudomonadota bacterium]
MVVIAVPTSVIGLLQFLGFEFERGLIRNENKLVAETTITPCFNGSVLNLPTVDVVLPSSGTEEITGNAILVLSKCEAWIAKNEIYARKGYVFKNRILNDHFRARDWYKPGGFDGLSAIEENNTNLLIRRVSD